MRPVRLAPNLIDHFYLGGERIAALRDIATTSPRQPEEWIASTVARADEWPVGLARTDDGALLRDLVEADPGAWTGGAGADTGILLKLLDAGQRLPVHVHPGRDFAARHLGCAYGKTEAWFVLDADPGAAVYVGWREDVDPDELARRRDAQDGAWMLERMHRIEVVPGDAVVVPAGTVHAIGAGILVAEAQEPTDFSILLEWSITTSGRDDSHLGLGFEAAMTVVETRAVTAERLAALVTHTDPAVRSDEVHSVLAADADPFFRLEVVAPQATSRALDAGFAAVVVLEGAGRLVGADCDVDVRSGQAWAVPRGFGTWRVEGAVRVLVARPAAAGTSR